MTCPNGHVIVLTARDGCPCHGDYNENEIDNVPTAALALAYSNPVCKSSREAGLKKFDELSISKECCCRILE